MVTLHFFLLILAAMLFFLAAFFKHERVDFLPLGLFFWVIATFLVVR